MDIPNCPIVYGVRFVLANLEGWCAPFIKTEKEANEFAFYSASLKFFLRTYAKCANELMQSAFAHFAFPRSDQMVPTQVKALLAELVPTLAP